jgi:hypothetical protein
MSIVKKTGLIALCLLPSLAFADQIHITHILFAHPHNVDIKVAVTAGKMNGSTCAPNHDAFSFEQVINVNSDYKMDGAYLFSKLHNNTYVAPDYTCVRETYSDNDTNAVLGEANYNLTGGNTVAYFPANPGAATFTIK